ncbi:MAG: type transport system permease protein [Actinomycetota bacterium]|jgi:ABC-type transport system involved in multi-copper enzyme maturation permease subunit|nr:type transport system permease protein [Actinomycetota bacterium]
MLTLIRIELRKLRTTPALYITLALAAALSLAGSITNVFVGGTTGADALGSTENVRKALSVAPVTSIVMLVLGILIVAGEYRHRTIMGTYLGEPARGKVLLAKLLVSGALGAVGGAVLFGIAYAVAVPLFAARGVHHLGVDVGSLWWGCILATACFGLLGCALGALTRNTVGAILGALTWVAVVELAILRPLLPSVAKWLPTGADVAVTSGGTATDLLSPTSAAVVLCAWAAVLALIATARSQREEIR